jgi:hypothetical protein
MIRFSFINTVVLLSMGGASGATCPSGLTVKTDPPHTMAGFSWGPAIQPMGDACVWSIVVDPGSNSDNWYVGGQSGLYTTTTGGQTWTHPLSGPSGALLLMPGNPPLVYAGIGTRLFLSRDRGANWSVIGNYPWPVSSIHVAEGRLIVGLGWSTHLVPSGVYVSNLGGGFAAFHPFGAAESGLIVWTIGHDALTGTLYAGTEIFDHPQPYHPPFFRSTDGGVTWTNVGGPLPWHVIRTAVRPADGYLYALTEGAGLYGSANKGTTWQPLFGAVGPGVSLLMDPNLPGRLFGGRQSFGFATGGIYMSLDAGNTFEPVGLPGLTVSDVALNGTSTRIYAAAYASGIYESAVR